MAKTVNEVFNDNQIAKGYNNYSGLTNLELLSVDKGETYFPRVNDFGLWRDGQPFVLGDGIERDNGFASTQWETTGITYQHWWYLYTSILGGNRSGKVTIKTRKYTPLMDDTMTAKYVIANAILTLPPPPDSERAFLGYSQWVYNFSRIDILHEDKMIGEIYVKDGSTSQDNIGTTAVKLTAFASDGISDGVTVSNSTDSLTIVQAGKYQVNFSVDYTSTVATAWTFAVRVDAVESNFLVNGIAADALAKSGLLDLSAGEVVTVYVESDDGGATADLTVVNAQLSLVSV
jgi:hypothetical protein